MKRQQTSAPSVKHGNVMIWGCFSNGKVGDQHCLQGTLNQYG